MPEKKSEKETKSGEEAKSEATAALGSDEVTGSESTRPPPDILPLFVSGPTQKIFECVADSDVTAENPYKIIRKEKIVADMKNRAAISDFHPAKRQMLDYPGDEVLVVYDADYKYGENFYVCISEEAKERVLNPPVEEVKEEEGEEGKVEEEEDFDFLARRRPWESFGSEKEIEEARVTSNRPLLKFVVSRQRRHFGSPALFLDRNAMETRDAYAGYGSYEDANFNLKKMELDKATQAVPEIVDKVSQTDWIKPCNAAVQYFPREYNEKEKALEVSKVEKDETTNDNALNFELSLQQNEIMAVFTDDLLELPDEETNFGTKSDGSLKEYQSFTDLQFSKEKSITAIDWHPTFKGVVAVSCVERLKLDERIDKSSSLLLTPSLILIWSFSDPIHPQLILEAPDDIFTFKFNPENPNIIAGGCINGQVILWDITSFSDRLYAHRSSSSKGSTSNSRREQNKTSTLLDDEKPEHAPMIRYCAVSSIEFSHTTCISHLEWIPEQLEIDKMGNVSENKLPGSCNQLMTCATDGTILFWDTRPPPKKKEVQVNESPRRTLLTGTVPQTFKYLDLSWKPFMKIPLPSPHHRGSLEFPAVRFSISVTHQKPLWTLKGVKSTVSQTSIKSKTAKGTGRATSPVQPRHSTSAGDNKSFENIDTHLYIGTEDGDVVYVNWKMTKDIETGRSIPSPPEMSFTQHAGPVLCVQRSPFFPDILLTVGGWDFCIWKEGVKSGPLLNSCSSTVRLTGGHWSPTRPGVLYITRCDGNIEVWDFLDKSHEPTKTQNVSAAAITSIYPFQMSYKQQLLAVGDQLGTLHIVEVPWNFRHSSSNEVGVMEAFFEREVNRVVYFEGRERTRGSGDVGEELQVEKEQEVGIGVGDELEQAYKAYLDLENKLLIQLGLRDEPTV
eukprot:m.135700 g.135700  ORF g.135700 m.135700 type:complete len:900 (+) comp38161_c0_seq11:190-2889(+)